ncbi:MAG: hypothetical protein EKK48_29505 [Candidatus Melainabacteria bacterium]|nr:MAG: hypothetical protein EKK48_29505 [Candidatus Melainabacteria bacterium]
MSISSATLDARRNSERETISEAAFSGKIVAMSWSRQADRLLVGANSGQLAILALGGGILNQWQAHKGTILQAHWEGSGDFIATSGTDELCKIWSTRSGECIATINPNDGWTEHLSWSPWLPLLLTSQASLLRVWTTTGALVDEQDKHTWPITALHWHPFSQSCFASAAADGLYTWKLGEQFPTARLNCKGYPTALKYNRSGSVIAYMSTAGLSVWSVGSSVVLHVGGTTTPSTTSLDWSWGGQWLACSLNSEARLWGFNNRAPKTAVPQALYGEIGQIRFVQFHDYDQLLAMSDEDGSVVIWRTDRRDRLDPVAYLRSAHAVSSLKWNPLAHILAIGYDNGCLRLWQHPFGSITNGEKEC